MGGEESWWGAAGPSAGSGPLRAATRKLIDLIEARTFRPKASCAHGRTADLCCRTQFCCVAGTAELWWEIQCVSRRRPRRRAAMPEGLGVGTSPDAGPRLRQVAHHRFGDQWSVSENPSSHRPAAMPDAERRTRPAEPPRPDWRRRSPRDQAPHAHLEQRRDVEGARSRRRARPRTTTAGAPETSDLDERGREQDRAVAIASHRVRVGLAFGCGLPPILELPRHARPEEQVGRSST